MLSYDKNEYKDLRAKFEREYKRVAPYKSRRPLTSDKNKIIEYKEALVETYNDIIEYFGTVLPNATPDEKIEIQSLIIENLTKLKESFIILGFTYPNILNIYEPIDLEKVSEDQTAQTVDNSILDTNLASSSKTTGGTPNNTNLATDPPNNSTNMAQTQENFISLADKIIGYKFSGDPLALDSFIDAINLLSGITQDANKGILLKFLMTQLEDAVRQAIENDPEEVDDILDQLKEHIKCEPSKVIEGRILAPRADKTNLTKFSERAEPLAEQFRRSLSTEGFSKEKAKEIAIEKTVEICRKSARSDTVKSIITSIKFSEPKEVIANLLLRLTFKNKKMRHKTSTNLATTKTKIQTTNFPTRITEIFTEILTTIVIRQIHTTAIKTDKIHTIMAITIVVVETIRMTITVALTTTVTITITIVMVAVDMNSQFVCIRETRRPRRTAGKPRNNNQSKFNTHTRTPNFSHE